ncbi:hypothetical protein HanOQP8_Chr08g0292471 [Helianthus annuus]|nr:hypothetical protein HanOQP8_Chr08g0292471 [Helianthus annuus]
MLIHFTPSLMFTLTHLCYTHDSKFVRFTLINTLTIIHLRCPYIHVHTTFVFIFIFTRFMFPFALTQLCYTYIHTHIFHSYLNLHVLHPYSHSYLCSFILCSHLYLYSYS